MKKIIIPTSIALLAIGTASGAITALSVTGSTDAGAYSIQTSLADGVLSYGDRTSKYFNITDNAPYLVGADYIRTANDDRNAGGVVISFTLDIASTVYVSHGDATNSHTFFGTYGFTDTGDDIGNFDNFPSAAFSVFSAELAAGDYTFDNDGQVNQTSMYTVMAQPIPEPSAALLGSLGILALLRRRR